MKKERKRNYLVGYEPDGNVVYGKEHIGACSEGYATPMTKFMALKTAKNFTCPGVCVWRLVKVKGRKND